MVNIGQFNTLKIERTVDFGAFVDGENLGEILVPQKYLPKGAGPGDMIEVFVYFDSEDRIIATREQPYAKVGEFAWLKVIAVNQVGAFLDWGLAKDLLVPFREQKQKMEAGKAYLVYIYVDEDTNRIVASAKVEKFLDKTPAEYQEGQEVQLIIDRETEIGYQAIINQQHAGMLYKNEIFKRLRRGLTVTGYIKKVREDGKIDLSLEKPGYEKVDDLSERVLDVLRQRGGFLALTDKSDAEAIKAQFGVSKKSFKKAVGKLYKQRLIVIEDKGIRLVA